MRVITLTPERLSEAARQLAQQVLASGCQPALLLGIQSGGARVAQLMRPCFAEVPYAEVRLSRPSTQQKQNGPLHHLLPCLPLWLCDVLRMAESRLGEWRSRGRLPERIGLTPDVLDQLDLAARVPEGGTILIIDDAIDTGATLHLLRQQLQARCPSAVLRAAVITVTTAQPVCDADFCLYRNRTLCRFPWSNDYRSSRDNKGL